MLEGESRKIMIIETEKMQWVTEHKHIFHNSSIVEYYKSIYSYEEHLSKNPFCQQRLG